MAYNQKKSCNRAATLGFSGWHYDCEWSRVFCIGMIEFRCLTTLYYVIISWFAYPLCEWTHNWYFETIMNNISKAFGCLCVFEHSVCFSLGYILQSAFSGSKITICRALGKVQWMGHLPYTWLIRVPSPAPCVIP